MTVERSYRATVSMGNKMFVVGGYNTTSFEVFDSFSGTLTTTKSDLKLLSAIKNWYFEAFSVCNNIVVFHHYMYIFW